MLLLGPLMLLTAERGWSAATKGGTAALPSSGGRLLEVLGKADPASSSVVADEHPGPCERVALDDRIFGYQQRRDGSVARDSD